MNIKWNAAHYEDNFSFVHEYGEDVMSLITAPEGAFVVDLGCGNGALTRRLSERGYRVLGVDASKEMLDQARQSYPDLSFLQMDARELALPEQADVIFSNAVLHWIDEDHQQGMIDRIAASLKPGGELVCEFGGFGCAERVHSALEQCFAKRGLFYRRTFFFPTIGEYAPMLEWSDLRVEYAVLFDRPTVQKSEDGLSDWINMFVTKPFEGIDPAVKEEILAEAHELLREELFVDGKWIIDYVRIRIRARKL